MTEGNRARLKNAAESLAELSNSTQDAQYIALVLLDVQKFLNIILTDVVLRPKVNS